MIDLYKGDCIEIMQNLIKQGVKVDAIITDPPYGTTACKWDSVIPFEPMWDCLHKLIKDNGAIVLFGSEPFSSALRMSNIKYYKYDWVWDKMKGRQPYLAKIQPMKSHENISVFAKNKTVYNPQMELAKKENMRDGIKNSNKGCHNSIWGEQKEYHKNNDLENFRYPKTIISISGQSNEIHHKRLHPTQKPVALLEYLIKTFTNEGETVLDFTMGSGSTVVACKNLNRKFIGIELDKKYFEIAEKRISECEVGNAR